MQLSRIGTRRHGRGKFETRVIDSDDPEYEKVLKYGFSMPYYNLIHTRMQWVPPEDLERLRSGLLDELRKRQGKE